jgi:hypothetical protein
MQSSEGKPAAQGRIRPLQTKRQQSIIASIMLGILNTLAEARERIRGLRTGHEPLHGHQCSCFVLLIPDAEAVCKDKIGSLGD